MLKKLLVEWIKDDLRKSDARELALNNDYSNPIVPFDSDMENRRFQQALIRTGIDAAISYHRAPDAPRFVPQAPLAGVPCVTNEQEFIQVAATVAALIMQGGGEGPSHQFYYWSRLPHLRQTEAWRALEYGAAPHGFAPALMRDTNVWVFGGKDWWLCEIRLVLGTRSTSRQLMASSLGGGFQEW